MNAVDQVVLRRVQVPEISHAFPAWPGGTINLLGIRVCALNLETAVAHSREAIAAGVRGYTCVSGVHGVIECQTDPALRQIHNRAFLVTPDGMPLVWALRLAGFGDAGRVYGPDLMLALFDRGRADDLGHFLYGTTPQILERLTAELLRRYPGARIVGAFSPPFRPLTAVEEDEIAERINASRADVVWVGLSTPKQEVWMARMRGRLTASMLFGVGAAFDFHAGVKRQAPRFMQRSGFEWLYRMITEPRRLARRYAVAVPLFLALAGLQALGLREFHTD